jgi:hypothetical protein
MKETFKTWLWKSDEEGITNFDFITMFLWNLMAWSLPIILYKILG